MRRCPGRRVTRRAAVRPVRGPRSRAAARLPARRRLGRRRPRHPRPDLPLPRPRGGRAGAGGRLPARARAPVPGGGGRRAGRGALRERRGRRLGADPARVAVGGDSAGGNLAAAAAARLHAMDGPAPAFQLLIYPVTDLSHKRRSYQLFQRRVLPHRTPDGLVSRPLPAHRGCGARSAGVPAAGGRPRGLPPAHVAVAGFDVLRDEGEEYAARLQEAGVPVSSTATPGSCTASATPSAWGERPALRCSRWPLRCAPGWLPESATAKKRASSAPISPPAPPPAGSARTRAAP